ncbi:endonuclease/exonuclease/phosphatase family protein [Kitasatospora sp. NPDC058115]|uniref:endonuclease/exonuclease/phosphatase family protein n=1 Tax=Kitasatospora sp. NPDC058115 TaxID=3346347 RepID=UPI0036DA2A7C
MKLRRPATALLAALLIPFAAPDPATAAPAPAPPPLSAPTATTTADAAAAAAAEEPDLSYANRTAPPIGMPDWSHVGYRDGQNLPRGESALTEDATCRVSPQRLADGYGVRPDDGADDTAGLQRAIDDIKAQCSPKADFNRLSLIELPAGRIDLSRQIYVDADFLTLRGKGSGAGGTRLVFRPDLSTRYDTVVNGRWDQDSMVAGTGSDVGTGGWMWPGRGMFRVQTREVAARYQDDWAAATTVPMRKDIFEGSVNQHWVSGLKLAAQDGDPGYSARKGSSAVRLDAKVDMNKFRTGGYVWVGAANSRNFYAQQGISDPSMIEALHMRQQMFKVVRVDAGAKTVTLDRPLEWDLPVNSESDGSPPINGSGTPYASKITPLKAVEGVGFEDFAFTQEMDGLPKIGGQETYHLTPEQAVHNYGNLAPEYAMHGIVFKWAANSWARGLNAEMTGSHPIVTENARNLQIEHNTFDGAWNKGKGGNGYLRGSRVWNSLWAQNVSRNLRHFTFQWSAGGNVAFRNDLDSDLNLHGGWEHNNLFEQNTLRIPYEHRSGSCQANCGGEGGEMDEGTWYPIWWAAGPKAGKWSGSSGPQNVFYNNTMLKQSTPGGPFEPYGPYGTRTGTAFQFGSDSEEPNSFQPLGQGGQAIADWTGRETLDYTGQGVVPLDVGKRHSLFLRYTGGELDPRTDAKRKVITWNMRGQRVTDSNNNSDKWQVSVRDMVNEHRPDAILLQEAGAPPFPLGINSPHVQIPQTTYHRQTVQGAYIDTPPVREYPHTVAGVSGYLYWLQTDTNPTGIGQMNLAIWTQQRAFDPADPTGAGRIFVVPSGSGTSSRPALGVRIGESIYFTVHMDTGGGQNATTLLNTVRSRVFTPQRRSTAVFGDFNTDLTAFRRRMRAQWDIQGVEGHTFPVNDTRPPMNYDFGAIAARYGEPNLRFDSAERVDSVFTSDHFPVLFTLILPPGDTPPTPTPAPTSTSKPKPKGDRTARSARTTNAPYPTSKPGSGTGSGGRRLGSRPLNRDTRAMATLVLEPAADHRGQFRILHRMTRTYLTQEFGLLNAPAVLLPEGDRGLTQVWSLVDMGDGTWIVLNAETVQVLAAVDGPDGEEVVLRDFDVTDASQRWFFQDPETEALDVDELLRQDDDPQDLVVAAPTSTAPGLPLDLVVDGHGPREQFTTVSAGRIGEDHCYYLVNNGRYVNTSAAGQYPLPDTLLTLDAFRPDHPSYLWCTDTPDRHATAGVRLTQRAADGGPLYLTSRGNARGLAVTGSPATADLWTWQEVPR